MKVSDKGIIGSYVHSRTTPNLGMKCSLIGLETDSSEPITMNENKETYDALKTLANNIAIHAVKYSWNMSFDFDVIEFVVSCKICAK